MYYKKGVILTVALIFIIVLTIVAAAAIALMTNQAQITEQQIKRIKAFYTAQAGLVYNLERLRQDNSSAPENVVINDGLTAEITFGPPNSGPNGTRSITAKVQF